MIKIILGLITLSLIANAEDFKMYQPIQKKIECTNIKDKITFSNVKQIYSVYDKNLSSIQLISCDQIKIKNNDFFTIFFMSEINTGATTQKILTYEVVALNGDKSEIIEQIDLSGDTVTTTFDSTVKATWGLSKAGTDILLKFAITTKNEKPFSYMLKLNKKLWFENIF
jgi:hypothetical protein